MGSLKSLNEKWHGLPKWAWALLIAVLIFGTYYLYKKRSAANSAANATPADAGTAAVDLGTGSSAPLDSSGGGGEYYPGNTPAGDTTTTETTNNYYDGDANPDNPTNTAPKPQTPTKTTTASPTKPTPAASKSAITVPKTATAISLQSTVAKPNAEAIFPKTAAENHPAAVKVSANKTGASANKTQGVFSIH